MWQTLSNRAFYWLEMGVYGCMFGSLVGLLSFVIMPWSYVVLGVFFVGWFYVMHWFGEVRVKRHAWLREHGRRVLAKVVSVIRGHGSGSKGSRATIKVQVEWQNIDGRIYRCTSHIGWMYGIMRFRESLKHYRQVIDEFVAKQGGYPVYVSPQNPHMYWLDDSWFELQRRTEKMVLREAVYGGIGYLLIIGIILALFYFW